MITKIGKWFSGVLFLGVVAVSIFAVNAIYFKPWSINIFLKGHFLRSKEPGQKISLCTVFLRNLG
jgi:hypothetical protein